MTVERRGPTRLGSSRAVEFQGWAFTLFDVIHVRRAKRLNRYNECHRGNVSIELEPSPLEYDPDGHCPGSNHRVPLASLSLGREGNGRRGGTGGGKRAQAKQVPQEA